MSQTQQEGEPNAEAHVISRIIIHNAEKVITFRSEFKKDCSHTSE